MTNPVPTPAEPDPRFHIDRRRRWMVRENYVASDGGWATAFRDPTDEEWAALASQPAADLDVERLVGEVLDEVLPFLDHPYSAQERESRIDSRMSMSRRLHARLAALLDAKGTP